MAVIASQQRAYGSMHCGGIAGAGIIYLPTEIAFVTITIFTTKTTSATIIYNGISRDKNDNHNLKL